MSANLTKHSDVLNDLCTNDTSAALFPNMAQFARICRVIPIHTADVERTFSQLKLIKTRTRNRMNEKTLDSLRIALEGPDVDKFPVAEVWASKKIDGYFHECFCHCISCHIMLFKKCKFIYLTSMATTKKILMRSIALASKLSFLR